MRYKKFLIGVLVALTLVAPVVVSGTTFALFDNAKDQACQGLGGCTANENGLTNTVRNVVNVLSVIIGVVSLVMIIVAGFKFITSAGDSSKTAGARSTIVSAVIGLVIVASAQFIVNFVLSKTSGLPACSKNAVTQTDGSTAEPGGAACKK